MVPELMSALETRQYQSPPHNRQAVQLTFLAFVIDRRHYFVCHLSEQISTSGNEFSGDTTTPEYPILLCTGRFYMKTSHMQLIRKKNPQGVAQLTLAIYPKELNEVFEKQKPLLLLLLQPDRPIFTPTYRIVLMKPSKEAPFAFKANGFPVEFWMLSQHPHTTLSAPEAELKKPNPDHKLIEQHQKACELEMLNSKVGSSFKKSKLEADFPPLREDEPFDLRFKICSKSISPLWKAYSFLSNRFSKANDFSAK